jgi:phosphoglycolate phosphatase-like HAD superfamily hydrolase
MAGVRASGLLIGGRSAEELKQAACIAMYRDPADLLAYYDGLRLVGSQT